MNNMLIAILVQMERNGRDRFQDSWRVNKLESDALVIRPIYYINQNLDLWLEAGIGRRDAESYNGKIKEHLYIKFLQVLK